MRIVLMLEGGTEKGFVDLLKRFLRDRVSGDAPRLDIDKVDGRIPKGEYLRKRVELLLRKADHVIALTDVYTGSNPPEFKDAAEAKRKMREWAGDHDGRFHAHAAQYEFEAWLIPYWDRIQALSKTNRAKPSQNPESINHNRPPSKLLQEVFSGGKCYRKTLDSRKILEGQDLTVAANECPELRSFLNTLLDLSGGKMLERV